MQAKTLQMELMGKEFKISNTPLITYANGYATVSLGDTVIMANALISEVGREGQDFFPLTVDFEENMYASGKIKGSRFVKREGRPSEKAVLTSRLIDRPIRPLFPKGTTNEVQLICSALSVEKDVDPATTAINAASTALMLSGAPFEGPIGAVRMGFKDDKLIINPNDEDIKTGRLNLTVAGTLDAITMVECASSEISEDQMLEALSLAHEQIKKICQLQLDFVKDMDIPEISLSVAEKNEEAKKAVEETVSAVMLEEVKGKTKMDVKKKIHEIEEKLFEKYAKELEEEIFTKSDLKSFLTEKIEANMRKNVLEKGERIDGRKVDEIRPISVQLDVLPRVHGSAIFQRGETTALTITTLGGPGDAQIIETMDEEESRTYFHHYRFPPYAVGEIKPLRGPSRRDIGHGDLAERALLPVLPTKEEFPYTLWLVSEIIRCNGSSSMASVCGSTLSLMTAGVPIKKPVSAIAMGLMMDKNDKSKYRILSDIQGLEDFGGDMDFKVAGTKDGITALQMDIKIKGLSLELMKEALEQAKRGRMEIMDKMLEALPEPRKELSKYAPLIMSMQIKTDFIKVVIGKGGEMINKIIAECGVDINIEDDGLVQITAPTQEGGEKAVEWIKKLTFEPKVGDIMEGKVVKILDFGAMVEFAPGKDGLVHISKLSKQRVRKVEDVVKLGDKIMVKLFEIDDLGRYNLMKVESLNGGPINAPEVVPTDPTLPPDAKEKPDYKTLGERVEGTHSVRKIV